MKKLVMNFATVVAMVLGIAGAAYAQSNYEEQPPDRTVTELDVLKTCKGAAQIATAEKVLNYMSNFKWWHIKNMYDATHPEYAHWHASRVFNAVVTPEEKRDALPYKNGIVTRENYVSDLAMVAFNNDVSKYINDLNRLECVQNDTVILSAMFHGLSVFRNKDGYVTHRVQLKDIAVRYTVILKDGLIYRMSIDLADATTVELFKKIKEEVLNTPPLAPDETTRTTYEQVLQNFKDQVGADAPAVKKAK